MFPQFQLPSFLPPAPPKLPRVLLWFRRDLRLEDNPALTAALEFAEEVIPIYIYAPEEEGQFQPGRCSRWWLMNSLRSLDLDLRRLGSKLLCFRATESRAALLTLMHELGAQGVLFNHLFDPISMVRDNEVKAAMGAIGALCRSFNGDVLREPWEVLDASGRPFSSFNEFWEAHTSAAPPVSGPLPAPQAMPALPAALLDGVGTWDLGIMAPEEEMSNAQLEYHWSPGCESAQRMLQEFVDRRLERFDRDRAKTDRNSTSRLSPHIHFGEVSVRTVHATAVRKAKEWGIADKESGAVEDFRRQVGYREYSRYLSFHFPFTHERALLEHLRVVPWRMDQSLFKAWRTGATGFPLVDAAMRELWSTGWMHNRMRVVCASFLVKDLLLPWQWGLKHYWDALLDADLECDALGWQYCAGCLVDAHPFSYRMDLDVETKRFDPDGNFVRRWMPVLSRLPRQYIHAPWKAPPEILAGAGVELGVNYPWPIVDLEETREALAAVTAIVDQAAAAAKGGDVGTKRSACDAALVPPCVSGPFRPATQPDPSAMDKIWGSSGGGRGILRASTVSNGRSDGGEDWPRRPATAGAALSLRSIDEALSEEVQSNVMGTVEESGSVYVSTRRPQYSKYDAGRRREDVGGDGTVGHVAGAAAAVVVDNDDIGPEGMLIEGDGHGGCPAGTMPHTSHKGDEKVSKDARTGNVCVETNLHGGGGGVDDLRGSGTGTHQGSGPASETNGVVPCVSGSNAEASARVPQQGQRHREADAVRNGGLLRGAQQDGASDAGTNDCRGTPRGREREGDADGGEAGDARREEEKSPSSAAGGTGGRGGSSTDAEQVWPMEWKDCSKRQRPESAPHADQ